MIIFLELSGLTLLGVALYVTLVGYLRYKRRRRTVGQILAEKRRAVR